MRITIKTPRFKYDDKDLKALFIIDFAFKLLEKRMILPTLEFFADTYGCKIEPK